MKLNQKMMIGAAVLAVVGGALAWSGAMNIPMVQASSSSSTLSNTASQVIHILAQHGYTPHHSVAKAGEPLRIEMETQGSYGCETAVYVPTLNFRTFLPPTGITPIDVPPQDKGTTLTVQCSMGMYRFDVEFE